MSARERSNLILDFAKVLFANGQATEQTIEASARLGRALGLRTRIIPRRGELELISEGEGAEPSVQVVADPTGVDMGRVASTVRLIEEVEAGRVAPNAASKAIAAISTASPAP